MRWFSATPNNTNKHEKILAPTVSWTRCNMCPRGARPAVVSSKQITPTGTLYYAEEHKIGVWSLPTPFCFPCGKNNCKLVYKFKKKQKYQARLSFWCNGAN
ncbi:unnamed protein product, partial [Ectocarpus sp. 6 AP-2014]